MVQALIGEVAIVTGASAGIGQATARLFARQGARVVVTARRESELDTLVAEIGVDGGEAVAVAGDIRDAGLAGRLVDTAVERFGGLDIAFNNAGATGALAPLPEIPLDGWRGTLEINLTSAFLGARHQIPAMVARGGGSLIFTSTFVGHTVGFPGMAAYAASKAGLIGSSRLSLPNGAPRGFAPTPSCRAAPTPRWAGPSPTRPTSAASSRACMP